MTISVNPIIDKSQYQSQPFQYNMVRQATFKFYNISFQAIRHIKEVIGKGSPGYSPPVGYTPGLTIQQIQTMVESNIQKSRLVHHAKRILTTPNSSLQRQEDAKDILHKLAPAQLAALGIRHGKIIPSKLAKLKQPPLLLYNANTNNTVLTLEKKSQKQGMRYRDKLLQVRQIKDPIKRNLALKTISINQVRTKITRARNALRIAVTDDQTRQLQTFIEKNEALQKKLSQEKQKWYLESTRQERLTRMKKRHESVKDQANTKARAYYEQNKAKVRQQQADHYQAHQADLRAKSRRYYQEHRTEISRQRKAKYALSSTPKRKG